MNCKCGDEKCIGYLLFNEKQIEDIEMKEQCIKEKYGDVEFNLKRSPISGEFSVKFYELHVICNSNKK